MKAQIKNIRIQRKEGTVGVDDFGAYDFATFDDAQAYLNRISNTAPEPATGTYDKTDFQIAWEGAESYAGRYDLQKGGLDDSGDTLREHVLNFLLFMAGEMKPDHMTDAQYKGYLRPESVASAKKFLAEQEI